MDIITSCENKVIKDLKKLKEIKYIKKENKILLENLKTIEEALKLGLTFEHLIFEEDSANKNIKANKILKIAQDKNIKINFVKKHVLKSLSDVKECQGVIGVLNLKELKNIEQKTNGKTNLIVALDNIQDPGNLGTIIRVLDSAGVNKLILSENTCYEYNPKVVRSTMGSIFRINIERHNLKEKLPNLKKQGYKIISSTPYTKKSIYNHNFEDKTVLIIGNEANGITDEILNLSDEKLKIPMLGDAESLNASIATSIIVYEYIRQILN